MESKFVYQKNWAVDLSRLQYVCVRGVGDNELKFRFKDGSTETMVFNSEEEADDAYFKILYELEAVNLEEDEEEESEGETEEKHDE